MESRGGASDGLHHSYVPERKEGLQKQHRTMTKIQAGNILWTVVWKKKKRKSFIGDNNTGGYSRLMIEFCIWIAAKDAESLIIIEKLCQVTYVCILYVAEISILGFTVVGWDCIIRFTVKKYVLYMRVYASGAVAWSVMKDEVNHATA